MRAALASRVAAHDAAAAEAAENEGDVEVRDALVAKAAALADAGDREAAVAAYAAADAKTAGAGLKLDSALALARLDMAYGDWRAVKGRLAAAAELAESGGDWERRNRLKMYQAATALATRDTAGAAGLLVDGVSTFTA
jgi:26S proteasome regulatory subunit N7